MMVKIRSSLIIQCVALAKDCLGRSFDLATIFADVVRRQIPVTGCFHFNHSCRAIVVIMEKLIYEL